MEIWDQQIYKFFPIFSANVNLNDIVVLVDFINKYPWLWHSLMMFFFIWKTKRLKIDVVTDRQYNCDVFGHHDRVVHLIDLRNLKSQAPNIFLGSIYMYKDPQKISLQKINV